MKPRPESAAALLICAALVLLAAYWLHQRRMDYALLRTEPTHILRDPALVRRALGIARPAFERHCAGCHGLHLEGDPKRGVPDLAAGYWLYDRDPVSIEHTILYGIRSGHPKARNLTDMPAMVRIGRISRGDARDLVEHLLRLAGKPHDAAAAERGRAIYDTKGNCYDCHGGDAQGMSDYGAAPLTGPRYLYGGDRETLYQSIVDGRHGVCPAWISVLSAVEVRALAVYLVMVPAGPPARN